MMSLGYLQDNMKRLKEAVKPMGGLIFTLVFSVSATAGDYDCAPGAVNISDEIENDSFYQATVKSWSQITAKRYLEGRSAKDCDPKVLADYPGYPTIECRYSNADHGAVYYSPIEARVILLEPSAEQLAAWSIHSCRLNGAAEGAMETCLKNVTASIMGGGGQFPIAGSVVESICASSKVVTSCAGLPENDPLRMPRNTLFRDGVAVYVEGISKWVPNQAISDDTYKQLFDFSVSDRAITFRGAPSRVSGALREDWMRWRNHVGKPIWIGSDVDFDLDNEGWQRVSREVHKAACKGDSNELIDALVYSRSWGK